MTCPFVPSYNKRSYEEDLGVTGNYIFEGGILMNPVVGLGVAKGESRVQAYLERKKPYKKSFKVKHDLETSSYCSLRIAYYLLTRKEMYVDLRGRTILTSKRYKYFNVEKAKTAEGQCLYLVDGGEALC